jgi:transcriptional regulator with XRE-family HTH domain
MRVFARRRTEIGLSFEQMARLSGIAREELERFEATHGASPLSYDHAVVLARVLGVKPAEMPGLRVKDEDEDSDVRTRVSSLGRALAQTPLLTFEGGGAGERFGGALERAITAPAFAIKIADGSLAPELAAGSVLALVRDSAQPGDVALVRSRKSRLFALRRLEPPRYVGLKPWQPSLPSGMEWLPLARVRAILPP